jgi:hypothetical protein
MPPEPSSRAFATELARHSCLITAHFGRTAPDAASPAAAGSSCAGRLKPPSTATSELSSPEAQSCAAGVAAALAAMAAPVRASLPWCLPGKPF